MIIKQREKSINISHCLRDDIMPMIYPTVNQQTLLIYVKIFYGNVCFKLLSKQTHKEIGKQHGTALWM
jgi:hypothetical protein